MLPVGLLRLVSILRLGLLEELWGCNRQYQILDACTYAWPSRMITWRFVPELERRLIGTPPFDAQWVEVMMPDGTTHVAHWASDLSGEEQPAFEGWYIGREGEGPYLGINTPDLWRPL